jgi:hypothetical protein
MQRLAAFPDVAAYSVFLLAEFVDFLTTSHVLIVQWDGFALNRDAWDDSLFDYDYIGAPWPQFAPPYNVGNGGFSLRSRKLLEALRDPEMRLHAPEDLCICRTNRPLLESRHGIRFAPEEVAARFAFERTAPAQPTFGFHGLFNFPVALPDSYREEIVAMPTALLINRDAIDLAVRLKASRDPRDRSLARRIAFRMALRRPGALPRLARAWLG